MEQQTAPEVTVLQLDWFSWKPSPSYPGLSRSRELRQPAVTAQGPAQAGPPAQRGSRCGAAWHRGRGGLRVSGAYAANSSFTVRAVTPGIEMVEHRRRALRGGAAQAEQRGHSGFANRAGAKPAKTSFCLEWNAGFVNTDRGCTWVSFR